MTRVLSVLEFAACTLVPVILCFALKDLLGRYLAIFLLAAFVLTFIVALAAILLYIFATPVDSDPMKTDPGKGDQAPRGTLSECSLPGIRR